MSGNKKRKNKKFERFLIMCRPYCRSEFMHNLIGVPYSIAFPTAFKCSIQRDFLKVCTCAISWRLAMSSECDFSQVNINDSYLHHLTAGLQLTGLKKKMDGRPKSYSAIKKVFIAHNKNAPFLNSIIKIHIFFPQTSQLQIWSYLSLSCNK